MLNFRNPWNFSKFSIFFLKFTISRLIKQSLLFQSLWVQKKICFLVCDYWYVYLLFEILNSKSSHFCVICPDLIWTRDDFSEKIAILHPRYCIYYYFFTGGEETKWRDKIIKIKSWDIFRYPRHIYLSLPRHILAYTTRYNQ